MIKLDIDSNINVMIELTKKHKFIISGSIQKKLLIRKHGNIFIYIQNKKSNILKYL